MMMWAWEAGGETRQEDDYFLERREVKLCTYLFLASHEIAYCSKKPHAIYAICHTTLCVTLLVCLPTNFVDNRLFQTYFLFPVSSVYFLLRGLGRCAFSVYHGHACKVITRFIAQCVYTQISLQRILPIIAAAAIIMMNQEVKYTAVPNPF